ncbi:MAG: aldehyde-activating protein [Proteobacteria bacterium SG_bin9]|nr:MAG: aldehyde-activating protein [Proteobacteria bacterium SG_bin9]
MSKSYTGGCACGAIRYEVADQPLFQNHCQCRDCQHKSGTGHGSYMTFPSKDAVTVTGQVSRWDFVADNGNVKTRRFCPRCGSPVYMTFSERPELFTIHAASLDDPARFRPQVVTYHARGHAWDTLDPALMTFDKMPGA